MLYRRDAMLRLGTVGLGAVALPGLLAGEQARAAASRPRGRAKSCILLFLWGGPPQQDLWDMKPGAPACTRSPFRPIRTVVHGIDICDQMPLLAKHTDKVAVVRSVSHASDIHEASVYHMLTGKPNPTLAMPRNFRRRTDFPNVGSVVSCFSPPGDLPACVTIPRPLGHDGVIYAGTYAGFLGPRHDPMEPRADAGLDPFNKSGIGRQPSHPLALPPDVDATRVLARRGLLHLIEAQDRRMQQSRAAEGLGGFYEQAFRMVSSPAAQRAVDLDREPAALRERYGRHAYGAAFLLAHRRVDAAGRLIAVTCTALPRRGGRA